MGCSLPGLDIEKLSEKYDLVHASVRTLRCEGSNRTYYCHSLSSLHFQIDLGRWCYTEEEETSPGRLHWRYNNDHNYVLCGDD